MTDNIIVQQLPNMTLLTVNSLSTRDEVITYYNRQRELLENWPEDRLYLVMHDLSHAQQVPWTPYIRQMAEELADAIPTHLQGRVAYVLPKAHTSSVIALFIRRDQSRRTPNVLYEVFYNTDQAMSWIEDALDIGIHEHKADDLYQHGQYNEAIVTYHGMLMAATATDDLAKQARALTQLGWIDYDQGNYEAAQQKAEEAESIARKAGAVVEIARALQIKGWHRRSKRDLDGALQLGQQALALCQEIGDVEEMARCHGFIGTILQLQHHYQAAQEHYQEATQLFRNQGLRRDVLTMLNKLGSIADALGNHQEAIRFYQQALNQAIEMNDRAAEIETLSFLGKARLNAGDFRQAEEDFQRIIHLTARTGETRGWITYVYISLALAYLKQGKTNLAQETAIQALGMQQTLGQFAAAWRMMGMIAARLNGAITYNGANYDAPTCFQKALEIFSEMNAPAERARTLRPWAEYERRHGDKAKGDAMFEEAQAIFRKLKLTAELME